MNESKEIISKLSDTDLRTAIKQLEQNIHFEGSVLRELCIEIF